MDDSLFSNPIALTVGGLVLLLVIYFWSRANTKTSRKRRQRNFRKNYYDRKKEKQKDT